MNPSVTGSICTQTTIAPGQREWFPHKIFNSADFFEKNGSHIAPGQGSGAPFAFLVGTIPFEAYGVGIALY